MGSPGAGRGIRFAAATRITTAIRSWHMMADFAMSGLARKQQSWAKSGCRRQLATATKRRVRVGVEEIEDPGIDVGRFD